jgi:hypothetical protein
MGQRDRASRIATGLGRADKRPSWWGASFSHHAQGGGSGRTVLACPTPSHKRPANQPGTRAGHRRRVHAWPTSLAPPLAPGGLWHAAVSTVPGSKGRQTARPDTRKGQDHDRGQRQLRRQPHRGPRGPLPEAPRIDGRDAVRPSALRPATAGHTAAVSWSATDSPDKADPRVLGDRAIALRQPRVTTRAACLHHDQPNQSTALQLLQSCRLPNQPAPARALVITDEASPFALRSTRNHPRRAMRQLPLRR